MITHISFVCDDCWFGYSGEEPERMTKGNVCYVCDAENARIPVDPQLAYEIYTASKADDDLQ